MDNSISTGEADSLVGQVLNDRYKIVELIHKGGASTMYKAVHELMDRTVAIKAIAQRLQTSNGIRRFQQEAQAASHLQYPGLVTVYDFGYFDGGPYLVMDYVEGATLMSVVEKDGPLSLPRFRKLFHRMSKSMSHAHEKGVIHRDLKPSHIIISKYNPDKDIAKPHNPLSLVEGDELPVVVDFRIAKLMPSSNRQTQSLTLAGEILGTPYYMSPEQCMAAAVDARSDIYSMGCSMYFALTGEPPFQGDSAIETMQMHMTSQPDTDRLPKEVRKIVSQAMEKQPTDRFQSMDALAKLLSGD